MRKMFLAGASLLGIVLLAVTPAFTNDTDKVVSATGNLLIDNVNKTGFFEWIRGGIGYTDKTLNWDITAFSNLSETKDTVTYVQTAYNRQKSVNRLNLGLGYRNLINTTTAPLIVGVNAFFDTKDGTKNILAFKASENFQRYSIGVELKTARFDMSANLYRPIGNNIIADKKVLQGWDITAKGNIPNYDQVSVGMGTYTFDGVGNTVVKGNKLIAEFKPNPMITVRGEYDKPNGESAQTDISVDFKWAFDKSIQDQMKSAPVPSAGAVWHKRYDKVERHYDIKTAEVDRMAPVGTTVQSTDIQDSTGDKTVRSGDGTTQDSAYALTSGKTYAINAFIGNVPSGVTPTVEAEVVGSGTSGTDFQFKNGATNIGVAAVLYTSTLEDKAGAGEVTLKLTYSADGFAPRAVFIKTQAANPIGSVLSDSDKASNDIKGGNGTTQATAYTLTNAKTYAVRTFVGTVPNGVTPTVKAEVVNGTSGTDFQFKNGSTPINANAAMYTNTLEDKVGAGVATLKLTYSATNFEDRVVYVKTDSASALSQVSSVTPIGSGKWGQPFNVHYNLKTNDQGTTFNAATDFTFSVVPNTEGDKGSGLQPTTAGIFTSDPIDSKTGFIDGSKLTQSGSLLVKIVRAAKNGLPERTDYENITVNKHDKSDHPNFLVTFRPGQTVVLWALSIAAPAYSRRYEPAGISHETYEVIPVGTTAGPVTGPNAVKIHRFAGIITNITRAGMVKIRVTYPANEKYETITFDMDVPIDKQVARGTLSVANLDIPYSGGDRMVRATAVESKLSIKGGSSTKDDWKLKSLIDKDGIGSNTLAIGADQKSMTIKQAITGGTTVTATFESDKYQDKSIDFKVSTTGSLSSDARTGLSGKWGKPFNVDYKLKTNDQGTTFNPATDFTFSVVPSTEGDKGSGLQPTTAGIFTSDPIDSKTGFIDGSKLTQSGSLLVKIVREAKNGLPKLTEYENITVNKQDKSDYPNFLVTVVHSVPQWASSRAIVAYRTQNEPLGTAWRKFSVIPTGTTAGPTTGANAVAVQPNVGAPITHITRAGVVKVRVTYPANEKYETMTFDLNVPINKQPTTDTLSMTNLVVPYVNVDKAVQSAVIQGTLTVTGGQTQKADWTLKSLVDKDGIGSNTLAISADTKSMIIKRAIARGTTVTATFENDRYKDNSIDFEVSTHMGTISGTRTGLSGIWGKPFAVNYDLKTSDTVAGITATFTPATDFTFSVVPSADGDKGSGLQPTSAGIFTNNPIDSKTGFIDGSKLTQSGMLLVKIVRAAKNGLPEITEYENITVDKQVLGTDVPAVPTVSLASGDNKWKSDPTTKFDMVYANLPDSQAVTTFDWEVNKKTGAEPSGTVVIDADGKISGATSAGTVVIAVKAKPNDPKYSGQLPLADFAIAKQTTTDTLSMADLVTLYGFGNGNKRVGTTLIQNKLSVTSTGTTQTRAGDWKLQSLSDKDGIGNTKLVINANQTMTIKGKITAGTTITAVFADKKNRYTDVSEDFTLSTSAGSISNDTRAGSGKWGKYQSYRTNYRLEYIDTVGDATGGYFTIGSSDYIFSIVDPSTDDGSGKIKTTPGIALPGAINSRTGKIYAPKLTKGGTLLVKIVRKMKWDPYRLWPEVTEYENFTVDKRNLSWDVTYANRPTMSFSSGSNSIWRNNGGNIPMDFRFPPGSTFDDYDWIIQGKKGAAVPDTIASGLRVTVAGIEGAISGGTVMVTMKPNANNEKYTGQIKFAPFTIAKQTIPSPLTVGNIVKPYTFRNVTVSEQDILSKVSVSGTLTQANDWTLKSLAYTGGGNLDVRGKSLTIWGAIPTPATVTATFENKKYTDVQTQFKVFTQSGGMSTTTPVGTGKWGAGQTYSTDYKLKGNDLGVVFDKNTDYTFSIVPPSRTVTGFTSTTAGIVKNNTLADAIDSKSGAIKANSLTKGGTLLIKIVRNRKTSTDGSKTIPELTVYQNFTIGKQNLGTDVPPVTVAKAGGEDGTWKTRSAAKIDLTYSNLPGGRSAHAFDWTVTRKTGTLPSGALKIDANGDISGATSGGTVGITLQAKANDEKYIGQFVLNDFTIGKQTTTDTLTIKDLVVPFATMAVTVDAPHILSGLEVAIGAKTQASEWTVKHLQNTDSHTNLVVNGNSLNITGAIANKTTVTAVLEHAKYSSQNVSFEVSTNAGAISTGMRTGSGKWGVGTYTTDYKLKTIDTVGLATLNFDPTKDFTFEIVPNGDGDKGSGLQPSTAGIALSGAIDPNTGAIDASKLTKSGILLVKIVRKAVTSAGGTIVAPALIEYENFTVDKQTQADHTNFKVHPPTGFRWSSDSGSLTYPKTNTPAGISSPQYFLVAAGTTAGTVTSSGPGTVRVIQNNGIILNTRASGIVKMQVVYPANDKYEKMVFNMDIPVKRRAGVVIPLANLSGVGGLDITYKTTSAAWGTPITPTLDEDDIGSKSFMPQVLGVPIYTPGFSITSRTKAPTSSYTVGWIFSNGAWKSIKFYNSASVGGNIDPATGTITGTQSSGTITATLTYPQNVRYEAGFIGINGRKAKDFKITLQRQPQTASAKSGHAVWDKKKTFPLMTRTGYAHTLYDIRSALQNVKGGSKVKVTLAIADASTGLTDGATFGKDYKLFDNAGNSITKQQAINRVKKNQKVNIKYVQTFMFNLQKAIRFTFTFPKTEDGKYGSKTVHTYWNTGICHSCRW